MEVVEEQGIDLTVVGPASNDPVMSFHAFNQIDADEKITFTAAGSRPASRSMVRRNRVIRSGRLARSAKLPLSKSTCVYGCSLVTAMGWIVWFWNELTWTNDRGPVCASTPTRSPAAQLRNRGDVLSRRWRALSSRNSSASMVRSGGRLARARVMR